MRTLLLLGGFGLLAGCPSGSTGGEPPAPEPPPWTECRGGPRQIASIDHAAALASDGETLFVLAGHWDSRETELYAVDPEVGAAGLVATAPLTRRELVVNGDHVYFATVPSVASRYDKRTIWRIPRRGGALEVLVDGETMVAFAPDDDDLWFFRMLELDSFQLIRRSLVHGTDTIVSRRLGWDFVVDEQALWVGGHYQDDVLLWRHDKITGQERIRARSTDVFDLESPTNARTEAVLQDAHAVYWVGEHRDETTAVYVVRFDKGSDAFSILGRFVRWDVPYQPGRWYDFQAADGAYLYYVEGPDYGDCEFDGDSACDVTCCPPDASTLRALSVTTGESILLAASDGRMSLVAMDTGCLYYADLGPWPSLRVDTPIFAIQRPPP
jgi:hypothetical protein